MADSSVKISLEIAGNAADKFLGDFVAKSDKADKSLGKLTKTSQSSFEQIGLHIGKTTGLYDIFVGNLAAGLAIKALDAITGAAGNLFNLFVSEGITAAKEQEQATHALNMSLAQTGIYSVKTAQEFNSFANQLQATTGIQDDVILKNAALIQSLAQLDKEGLKRATLAAMDLSVALGKDFATTSEMVAKAANGNITSFQKLGIEIQKGRTDAETFNNALKTLEAQFGGRAAGAVNTFGGAVSLVRASFGELQEQVGETITQNLVVVSILKSVSDIFTQSS
jgi:hypothetical protein